MPFKMSLSLEMATCRSKLAIKVDLFLIDSADWIDLRLDFLLKSLLDSSRFSVETGEKS